jgi:hypothetical protein
MDCRYVSSTPNDRRCYSPTKIGITMSPPLTRRSNSDLCCTARVSFWHKRARAYATDVRSWWKLTYERSGGIRVLTPSRRRLAAHFALQRPP